MSALRPSPPVRLPAVLAPALVALLALACTRTPGASSGPSGEVFRDLSAFFSPDYPATPERLEACRASGPRACVEAYEQVQEARQALLADGQEAAARQMLRVLSFDCAGLAAEKLSGAEVPAALARCRGVGVALALIDDPVLDARFRRFLSFQPLELSGLVLATGGEPWAHGRREPAAWSALLRQSAPRADGGVDAVWEQLAREVEAPSQRHAQPVW